MDLNVGKDTNILKKTCLVKIMLKYVLSNP